MNSSVTASYLLILPSAESSLICFFSSLFQWIYYSFLIFLIVFFHIYLYFIFACFCLLFRISCSSSCFYGYFSSINLFEDIRHFFFFLKNASCFYFTLQWLRFWVWIWLADTLRSEFFTWFGVCVCRPVWDGNSCSVLSLTTPPWSEVFVVPPSPCAPGPDLVGGGIWVPARWWQGWCHGGDSPQFLMKRPTLFPGSQLLRARGHSRQQFAAVVAVPF